MPNNFDAIRSLNVIAQLESLFCRRHPGSTEDLFCLSCSTMLCAECHVTEHAQHNVDLVKVAAENFRAQLVKHIELVETLEAHLARTQVARRVLEDRASDVQRLVSEKEKATKKHVESNKAVLLEQLAGRLNPLKRKVEDVQKSLSEVIGQRQTIVDNPRELVRHFPAMQAKLEHLSERMADINVDEIERQKIDFRPFSLTDWIPLESVNLIGRLTSSSADDTSDPPTMKELEARLDAARKRESSLVMELEETKEHNRVASTRLSEQAILHKQREAGMAEREHQLRQCVDVLRTRLVKLDQNEKLLAQMLQVAALEKTELERKVAIHEEQLSEASRRISELEAQAQELKDQTNAGELRQRDLEERLRTETGWRRNAEAKSRERRHQNEDLMTRLEEDRQNAERKYEELQDRVATLLKNAKEQSRLAVWTEAQSRENSIRRQAVAKQAES